MKLVNLTQGSDAWRAWRMGGIGGSDAPAVMGVSPWVSPRQLYEQKTTLGAETPINDAMRRGMELEPRARAAYESMTGHVLEPACAVHEEYDWLRMSFDGLTFDGKHAVEIKCPGRSAHNTALEGCVPEHYIPQVQHAFLIGVETLDYFSFDGESGVIVPVTRDDDYLEELFDKEVTFWDCVVNHRPPKEAVYSGCWTCEDIGLRAAAQSYLEISDALDAQKRTLDRLKAQLLGACQGASNRIGPLSITRVKGRATLDAKALEKAGVDLSPYRKRGDDSWRITRDE